MKDTSTYAHTQATHPYTHAQLSIAYTVKYKYKIIGVIQVLKKVI